MDNRLLKNEHKKSEYKKGYSITCALTVIGVVLVIVGIVRGEPVAIYDKAIRICMECIGIG